MWHKFYHYSLIFDHKILTKRQKKKDQKSSPKSLEKKKIKPTGKYPGGSGWKASVCPGSTGKYDYSVPIEIPSNLDKNCDESDLHKFSSNLNFFILFLSLRIFVLVILPIVITNF